MKKELRAKNKEIYFFIIVFLLTTSFSFNLYGAEIKKKVVYLIEDNLPHRIEERKLFVDLLKSSGWINGQTIDLVDINMKGKSDNSDEIVEKIKGINPDLLVVGAGVFVNKNITSELYLKTDIPIITAAEVDVLNFVHDNDRPKGNVTGIRTRPRGMIYRSLNLLNEISPIKNKKAVFVSGEGFFIKEEVMEAARKIGVEIEEYTTSEYFEDFRDTIEKYNNDPEIGWILVGVWPVKRKDDINWSIMDTANWDVKNRKKPTITYWEPAVKMGLLAALGVDIKARGSQLAHMADRLLNGETISNIKAEDPKKINIVLNHKRAKELGIVFPVPILAGAYRVYTDNDGNYIGKK